MDVKPGPQGTEVTMQGSITERTVLEPPAPLGQHLIIDCAGIERINSMGVRAWIQFFENLGTLGVPVTLRRLSPALVLQASMISSFLGRAEVESFFAPYYCGTCEHAEDRLFRARDEVPERSSVP